MGRASRALTFLRRRGHAVAVRGADGRKHEATLVKLPKVERKDSPQVVEKGSFTFGYCKSCDWTGPARRARDKAVRDAVRHDGACPGKPNVRVGVLEDDPRR